MSASSYAGSVHVHPGGTTIAMRVGQAGAQVGDDLRRMPPRRGRA